MVFLNRKFKSGPARLIVRSNMGGFTIVELLVVISIFLIISGVVLFNFNNFKNNASLQNVVQDVAINIRKAQGYALGFKSSNNISSANTNGFGIYINGDFANGTSARMMTLFADMAGSGTAGKCDVSGSSNCVSINSCGSPSSSNECLEKLPITTTDKITSVCLSNNGTSKAGTSTGHTSCIANNDSFTVYFNRPNPDANFCWWKSGSSTCLFRINSALVTDITINLSSADSVHKRQVVIWNTGQISVK